jgi:hypothetical protein
VGGKYNPYTLPLGRVYLDGWIFETLDPYTTTEHYAIPSTRVRRLVAIDFAGSMPAAYNTVINGNLPRSVLALRAYLMKARPLPSVRMPVGEMFVEEVEDDEEDTGKWVVENWDEERVLASSRVVEGEGKVVKATIRITPLFKKEVEDAKQISIGRAHGHRITSPPRKTRMSVSPAPRPSAQRAQSSSRSGERADEPTSPQVQPPTPRTPTRTNRADTLPSSPHPTLPPIAGSPDAMRGFVHVPSPGHRRVLSTSGVAPPNILPLVRSMPGGSIFTSPTFSSNLLIKAPDFCVAEVVVDPALYGEKGYSVKLESLLDNGGKGVPYSPSSLPESSEEDTSLPLVMGIYTIPSGAMHPIRHLLRITLPTSPYFSPSIEDPLTGEERKPAEKPSWLVKLEAGGARVDLQITPTVVDAAQGVVIINGEPSRVLGEKESLDALGRRGLEGESLARYRGRVKRYVLLLVRDETLIIVY